MTEGNDDVKGGRKGAGGSEERKEVKREDGSGRGESQNKMGRNPKEVERGRKLKKKKKRPEIIFEGEKININQGLLKEAKRHGNFLEGVVRRTVVRSLSGRVG